MILTDKKIYSDNDLALRISKSDISAFDQFFMDMYPPMFILAKRLAQNEDLAKDIVSDSFLHLWEIRTSLPNVRDLKAYLYTITRNRALDLLKKQKRSRQREEKVLEEEWLAKTSETFLLELFTAEKTRVLYTIIKTLPTECSKVVLLGLEGYQTKEIADKLSISVSAVSNQKNRAVKLLRERIEPGLLLLLLLWFRFT